MTARNVARDMAPEKRKRMKPKTIRRIGLIEADLGSTPVQAWSPPEALEACKMPTDDCRVEPSEEVSYAPNCTNYPSALFNTMIYPIAGLGLRAFLWMHGESNTDRGYPLRREEYRCISHAMISSWRKRWAAVAGLRGRFEEIPFLFVQLSSWLDGHGVFGHQCDSVYCPGISRIRLAQADLVGMGSANSAFKLPFVGMAVSHDSGTASMNGFDSKYKSVPALRLSWQVRAKAFGEPFVSEEPPMPDFKHGRAYWDLDSDTMEFVITVPLTNVGRSGIVFRKTQMCEKAYSRDCCRSNGLTTARVCMSVRQQNCETDNPDYIQNARMEVGKDKRSLVIRPVGKVHLRSAVETPHWLDMFQSDFPLCAVVDKDRGLAMSPFAFLRLKDGDGALFAVGDDKSLQI